MIEYFKELCKRISSPTFMASQTSYLKELADVIARVEAVNSIKNSITSQCWRIAETYIRLFDI